LLVSVLALRTDCEVRHQLKATIKTSAVLIKPGLTDRPVFAAVMSEPLYASAKEKASATADRKFGFKVTNSTKERYANCTELSGKLLQALVYDILLLAEEGAGKRLSECGLLVMLIILCHSQIRSTAFRHLPPNSSRFSHASTRSQ